MAKKKSLLSGKNRLFLIGGGGAVGAVVIAVFVFGVGLDFINPPFEQPQDLTVQEVQENQEVIFDIDEVLCGGGILPQQDLMGLDPELEAQAFASGGPCIPSGETNSPGEETTPEEIEEMVEEINEMVNEPDIPTNQTMTNQTQTEFSEDGIIGQICDELDLGCGSDTLALSSTITKIDSDGEVEIVEGRFSFEQLSFVVEDISNKDYATGRLIVELKVIGEPNTAISGIGTANIGILSGANLDLFKNLNELNLQVADTTDANGEAVVFFVGPTGALSPTFTFEFASNFNEFANEAITPLKLTLVRLDVNEGTNDFALANIPLLTMDIARDDERIVITNEEGVTERVFPSDSRLVLTTVSNVIRGTSCLVYKNLDGQNPEGCGAANLNCPCLSTVMTSNPTNKLFNVIAGTAPAPSVTGIILLDGSGQFLVSNPGGTGEVLNELITRNANYTLKTSSPDITSSTLFYGKTQETKSFTCQSDGTAKQKVEWVVTGNTARCGDGGCNYYVYIQVDTAAGGFTVGATQCNIP